MLARMLLLCCGVSLTAIACGSTGDSDPFAGGAAASSASGGSAGEPSGGEGGSDVPSGGLTHSGGTGAGAAGAGGSAPTAGSGGSASGAGGTLPSTGGMAADGGGTPADGGVVPVDGGVVPGQLPTGFIVTEACADCLVASCPDEVAACTSDPNCVQGVECLNTCVLPPVCGACFVVSGVVTVPPAVPPLNDCAAQYCTMCPTLG